jgi:hypothetical protein
MPVPVVARRGERILVACVQSANCVLAEYLLIDFQTDVRKTFRWGLFDCETGGVRGVAPTRTGCGVLTAPHPNATLFGVLLCLPTAPGLPLQGNGDFGTSAFFRQLSDKPVLARI